MLQVDQYSPKQLETVASVDEEEGEVAYMVERLLSTASRVAPASGQEEAIEAIGRLHTFINSKRARIAILEKLKDVKSPEPLKRKAKVCHVSDSVLWRNTVAIREDVPADADYVPPALTQLSEQAVSVADVVNIANTMHANVVMNKEGLRMHIFLGKNLDKEWQMTSPDVPFKSYFDAWQASENRSFSFTYSSARNYHFIYLLSKNLPNLVHVGITYGALVKLPLAAILSASETRIYDRVRWWKPNPVPQSCMALHSPYAPAPAPAPVHAVASVSSSSL